MLLGIFALALGAIVRNTAGGIAVFAAIFFVIPPLLNILPTSWNNAISPVSAGRRRALDLLAHPWRAQPRARARAGALRRLLRRRDRDRRGPAPPSRRLTPLPARAYREPAMIWSWLHRHPLLVDLGLAVAVGLPTVAVATASPAPGRDRAPGHARDAAAAAPAAGPLAAVVAPRPSPSRSSRLGSAAPAAPARRRAVHTRRVDRLGAGAASGSPRSR